METEFIGFEDGELAYATSSYKADEDEALSQREQAPPMPRAEACAWRFSPYRGRVEN